MMLRKVVVVAAAIGLAGCWTFNETPYPECAITPPKENSKLTLQITGFETLLTEFEAVHGFQTVYVPSYYGMHHMHPGYFETVPVMTMVPQRRSSDMFLRRAQDMLEKAGFTLAVTAPDCIVDVHFDGPFVSSDDALRQLGWQLGTIFFCDYGASSWTAQLRIRDGKTGKLLFHHDYTQNYEVNVFALIPLFGPSGSDATNRAKMQSWCLAALTDRVIADVTAYLAK